MTDEERYLKDKATVMAIIKYILIILILAAVVIFATKITAIMMPFLVGFLIAKTSHSIATQICKSLPGDFSSKKRKKISLVVYGILVALIVIILLLASGLIALQAFNAFKNATSYVTGFDYSSINFRSFEKLSQENGGFITEDIISSLEDAALGILTTVLNYIPTIVKNIITGIISWLGNLPYIFFLFVSCILSGHYFLKDTSNVLRIYYRTIPNRTFRKRLLDLLNELSVTLFNVLGGYLSLLIITALESFVVFTFAGVKYSAILAIITSVVDFLPVLGTSAVMVPIIIIDILHANYIGAIILIIGLTAMTLIRRVIEPAILGKSMKIHPLITLIAMAIGVYIWGLSGFLIGPTVFIIIMTVFKVFGFGKQLRNFLSKTFQKFMFERDEDKKTNKNSKKEFTTRTSK